MPALMQCIHSTYLYITHAIFLSHNCIPLSHNCIRTLCVWVLASHGMIHVWYDMIWLCMYCLPACPLVYLYIYTNCQPTEKLCSLVIHISICGDLRSSLYLGLCVHTGTCTYCISPLNLMNDTCVEYLLLLFGNLWDSLSVLINFKRGALHVFLTQIVHGVQILRGVLTPAVHMASLCHHDHGIIPRSLPKSPNLYNIFFI